MVLWFACSVISGMCLFGYLGCDSFIYSGFGCLSGFLDLFGFMVLVVLVF